MNNADTPNTQAPATRNGCMHIAIVTETFPPEVNGVAMTLGRIVEGLLQRGHTVQIVRPRQPDEQHDTRTGIEHVLVRGIPVPTYGELRFGLPSQSRLKALWGRRRPDIVHVVTEGPLGWSAIATARALRLPVTSSFHTNFHSYTQHYGIGLLRTPIEAYLRKLHNRTLATMVPTRAMLHELTARGYDNVTLVSRGVATDLFHPGRRSQALRASWGVLPHDPVVILVGRLAKEKNVGLVVSAFRAIQARNARAKLVFVGDGPLRKALETACPQAHFAGVRKHKDLAAHYASADLFLFPSLTETFGNVVPEALASGLAVVSYANAAAQELITPHYNGILIPNGDEAAFISASEMLAADAPLQQQLRELAAPSIAHLAWGAVCAGFEAVLQDAHLRHLRQPASGLPTQERLPHLHTGSVR